MIDPRIDSIISQSQTYYRDLINSLEESKKIGKALEPKWDKADTILGYLEALNYLPRLTDSSDIDEVNYILECLIKLCELNQYPVSAPITFQPPPSILVGQPGPQGLQGIQGPRGFTGLATDFSVISTSITIVVDSFPISSAKAARWDYLVVSNTGAQRASSVVGQWTPDGLNHEVADDGTDDLIGDTSGIEFDINISGSTVQLVAIITSGIWSIYGSRYFIPNNGNGSGPITNVLPLGQVYIGNSSNQAQAQSISGDITITNSGVTTISANAIVNSKVSTTAAIALSKLAALAISKIAVTDSSGVLTTLNSPTLIELGYVGGVTSAIQTQLNAKLTDPMTTIGDIVIRNASNVTTRLGVGTNTQILTVVGGVPTWANPAGGITGLTTGFIPKASSSTTLANSIISEATGAITIAGTAEVQGGVRTQTSGPYYKYITINIGAWSMNSAISKSTAHGLPDHTKIRRVSVVIISDLGGITPIDRMDTNTTGTISGSVISWDSVNINMQRYNSGIYNTSNYSNGVANRGTILIEYEA